MAAWARGQEGDERPFVFAEKNYTNYYDPTRMVRSQRYKYVHKGLRTCVFDFLIPEIEGSPVQFRMPQVFGFYSARRCTEELYDLGSDPGELANLVADAAYADVLAELRHALNAHLLATEDPFREIKNGLMMPEDQYSPAMEAMYRRAAGRAK
jgi:arylsulfatase A-like enzyme